MPFEPAQAQLLEQWFKDPPEGLEQDLTAITQGAGITRLREQLGELWFTPPDPHWYEREVEVVLNAMSQWIQSPDEEAAFTAFATAGQAGQLIPWLEQRVQDWLTSETKSTAIGVKNPDYASDPIPGTQQYKMENGEYLYSTDPATDWRTMPQRIEASPHTEPVYDETYGMRYRYHRITQEYQWEHPERMGYWISQQEADVLIAQRTPLSAPSTTQPDWDGNWEMFYKFDNGEYLYAYPKERRRKDSGPSNQWLTYDQALQSTGPAPAVGAPSPVAQAAAAPAEPGESDATEQALTIFEKLIEAGHHEFPDLNANDLISAFNAALAEAKG